MACGESVGTVGPGGCGSPPNGLETRVAARACKGPARPAKTSIAPESTPGRPRLDMVVRRGWTPWRRMLLPEPV